MYWSLLLFIVALALAVTGIIGALPGIILGLVFAVLAIVLFVGSGKDADSPQIVSAPVEPTGEVRGGSGRFTHTGDTANERIEQT
jgi:uncharacterized protein (DUF58 family)